MKTNFNNSAYKVHKLKKFTSDLKLYFYYNYFGNCNNKVKSIR